MALFAMMTQFANYTLLLTIVIYRAEIFASDSSIDGIVADDRLTVFQLQSTSNFLWRPMLKHNASIHEFS